MSKYMRYKKVYKDRIIKKKLWVKKIKLIHKNCTYDNRNDRSTKFEHAFSQQTFWLVTLGKAHVSLLTFDDGSLLLKQPSKPTCTIDDAPNNDLKMCSKLCVDLHTKTTNHMYRYRLTWTMAGSWGRLLVALGGSQTVRSLMSLPRKMMYSNTSSRGGIGLSVGRSSVPKERTVGKIHRIT